MTRDVDDLMDEILELPANSRLVIVVRILDSLSSRWDDADDALIDEIERRCAELDSGEVNTSDWNEFRERIEREIFHRS